MNIRKVLATDADEWLRLRSALWPDASRDVLALELEGLLHDGRCATFVCERDGTGVAGFIEVSLRDYAEGCETSPVGFIEGWYVDAEVRRRGIGRALVEAAEAWAIGRGCTEMASDSLLENVPGHAAHRALGYEEVERLVCFRKDLHADRRGAGSTTGPSRSVRLGPRPFYVAVVGPGEDAPANAVADAEEVGRLLALRGWITLCGGRSAGVMEAAASGVTSVGGVVVGLLPSSFRGDGAPALTVALATGLGEARNSVLATAADGVIGCGMNPGTASELALALRAGKPTVLVRPTEEGARFFRMLAAERAFHVARTALEAVEWLAEALPRSAPRD